MARTWLSVSVELLGGRGDDLWPWPGRIFAVGPQHTFMDLANAINDAFARWDRSHLSMFTLADGSIITDVDSAEEFASSAGGPILAPIDIDKARVVSSLRLGAEFRFVFDLGDEWTHLCTVHEQKMDPNDELGIQPSAPRPYWGWGTIPDQYGRRWTDDDGEGPVPRRPRSRHPMLTHDWPGSEQLPELDLRQVRSALATGDATQFLSAIIGRDVDDALQMVATGIPLALEKRRDDSESLALSFINRLTMRVWEGDQVLAQELLALLRGETPPGADVAVDLDMLCMVREGDVEFATGGYIDLRTGQVHSDCETDAATVGEDVAIDVESDPDRWLQVDSIGSRAGWNDMASFIERLRNSDQRERLRKTIEGSGAFRRFRDLLHQEGLVEQWIVYSDDRKLGRARDFLAEAGVRVA